MSPRQKIILANWLRNSSYNKVKNLSRFGLVDNERFEENTRRAFFLIWEWSSVRLSSEHQNRVYAKHGSEFVNKRIERCNKLVKEFLS